MSALASAAAPTEVVTPLGEGLSLVLGPGQPDEYGPRSRLPLFFRRDFFELHCGGTGLFFRIADEKGALVGSFACAEEAPGVWRSPRRGSYGGLHLQPGFRGLGPVERVLEGIEAELRARGAMQLRVTLAPQAYDDAWDAQMMNVFLRRHYRLVRHELSYARAVTQEPFAAGLRKGNRKNLARTHARGFTFGELSLTQLPAAHALIAANRARRGFPMTMSLQALQSSASAVEEHYRIFGVEHEGELAAAAICVPLSPEILYVFYWGEAQGQRNPSPIPLLAEGLYRYAAQAGFCLLDVGTSTVDGEPNHGLIRFKESLGFTPRLKLELEISFGEAELPS